MPYFRRVRALLTFCFILTLSILLRPSTAIRAATIGAGFSATPGCTALNTTLGAVTWDRNNTGTSRESWFYQVTDGAGTILVRSPSVGAWTTGGLGLSTMGGYVSLYTTLPTYNPLKVQYISIAGNGFLEQVFYTATANCSGLPTYTGPVSGYQGPSVPGGFVLRTITCDVAVFNTPGGIPVASGASIKAGQTWYVNPTPVNVTNNALYPQWTEIFNSGTINGFIPTKCVGGKPAGYAGN